LIRKIGMLGGTFDPVHNGHLALAEAAGKLCDLSEIVLLPAAVPPHKQNTKITDFEHRVAMLEAAVKGRPGLQISPIEQLLPSPSYTIDTLHYLKIHSVGDVEWYFIIGADAFLDILSWKEYRDLLASCHFIVYTRKGNKAEILQQFFKQLGYRFKENCWIHKKSQKSIFTSSSALPSVSSSEIRDQIRRGNRVSNLTPVEVVDYIKQKRLYLD